MDPEVLRDGMRAAVADEPPLGFDPDDVVTEASHRRRRRRATAGVAVTTLALLAATVGLVPALRHDTPPRPAAAVNDDEWPPPGMRPLEITQDELWSRAARLEEDWAKAVWGAVPDAKEFRPGPSDMRGPVPGRRGSATVGLSAYLLREVTAPGVGTAPIKVGLDAQVFGPGSIPLSLREVCAHEDGTIAVLECRRKAQPDGSMVVDILKRLRSAGTGSPSHELFHFRPDGTVVFVSATFLTAGVGQPGWPLEHDITNSISEPPMSSRELVTLATDPGLTLSR